MCYLGIGDTCTPAHKDLCASSGHNLMCYTENSGSSFWFMTKSSDAPNAAKYFQNELGQELDHESYVATPEDFANAPFTVYIGEQKLGDLVLVPKRSCHQVVNTGGLTVKSSWSRMTIDGLVTAFHHELPIYRRYDIILIQSLITVYRFHRVCRPETYRVRALCYFSLMHYTDEAEDLQKYIDSVSKSDPASKGKALQEKDNNTGVQSPRGKDKVVSPNIPPPLSSAPPLSSRKELISGGEELVKKSESTEVKAKKARLENLFFDLKKLMELFDAILKEEYDDGMVDAVSAGELLASASNADRQSSFINLSCDFCGADIFESYFDCKQCAMVPSNSVDADESIIICPGCYAEGRTCECTKMRPRLSRPFQALIEDRNRTYSVLQPLCEKKIWRPVPMCEA